MAVGRAMPPPHPGPAGPAGSASAQGNAEAPRLRLAGRPHRAAARARPYRAQRDRSRLGHHRAVLRRRTLPRAFFDDWVGVAAEEAAHFELLANRLGDFGARYGDLPAHDGLWEAASATAEDLLARLAVVPLVLEARGLDVTPEMMARLERVGDMPSAEILRRIYRDEIGHVAIGLRWFERLCRARGLVPEEVFRDRVKRCFKGDLKPPFNLEARSAAGFPPHYYEPLATG